MENLNKQDINEMQCFKQKESFDYENYFISEEAFLIFVLLYIDGEKRADLLSITEDMYESLSKAKKWRNNLVQLLHPDRCKHPLSDQATSKVNEIYARMKKHAK